MTISPVSQKRGQGRLGPDPPGRRRAVPERSGGRRPGPLPEPDLPGRRRRRGLLAPGCRGVPLRGGTHRAAGEKRAASAPPGHGGPYGGRSDGGGRGGGLSFRRGAVRAVGGFSGGDAGRAAHLPAPPEAPRPAGHQRPAAQLLRRQSGDRRHGLGALPEHRQCCADALRR